MASPGGQREYPLRVMAACGVVALLALAASLDAYRSTYAYNRAYADPYRVNVQPRRFREVYSLVPAGTVMGYLSDLSDGSARGGAYLAAQHALAPRLLVDEPDVSRREWVLGNYSQPQDYGKVGREHGLRLVQDLGNGAALFRREVR